MTQADHKAKHADQERILNDHPNDGLAGRPHQLEHREGMCFFQHRCINRDRDDARRHGQHGKDECQYLQPKLVEAAVEHDVDLLGLAEYSHIAPFLDDIAEFRCRRRREWKSRIADTGRPGGAGPA